MEHIFIFGYGFNSNTYFQYISFSHPFSLSLPHSPLSCCELSFFLIPSLVCRMDNVTRTADKCRIIFFFYWWIWSKHGLAISHMPWEQSFQLFCIFLFQRVCVCVYNIVRGTRDVHIMMFIFKKIQCYFSILIWACFFCFIFPCHFHIWSGNALYMWYFDNTENRLKQPFLWKGIFGGSVASGIDISETNKKMKILSRQVHTFMTLPNWIWWNSHI